MDDRILPESRHLLYYQQDYQKGFPYLQKAVTQGDPTAKVNLADCYLDGLGVKPDIRRAVILYHECQNSTEGYYVNEKLGDIYLEGREDIPVDKPKALYHYRQAFLQGNLEVIHRIRVHAHELNGCALSPEDVRDLFSGAYTGIESFCLQRICHDRMTQGKFDEISPYFCSWQHAASVDAKLLRASVYAHDLNPRRDLQKAYELYGELLHYEWNRPTDGQTVLRDIPVEVLLAHLHLKKGWDGYNPERAVSYFNGLMENGQECGCFHLGMMYLTGNGIGKDKEKAFQLFSQSPAFPDSGRALLYFDYFQREEGEDTEDILQELEKRYLSDLTDVWSRTALGYFYKEEYGIRKTLHFLSLELESADLNPMGKAALFFQFGLYYEDAFPDRALDMYQTYARKDYFVYAPFLFYYLLRAFRTQEAVLQQVMVGYTVEQLLERLEVAHLLGHPWSTYFLGMVHAEGWGVEPDAVCATRYLYEAERGGLAEASYKLYKMGCFRDDAYAHLMKLQEKFVLKREWYLECRKYLGV